MMLAVATAVFAFKHDITGELRGEYARIDKDMLGVVLLFLIASVVFGYLAIAGHLIFHGSDFCMFSCTPSPRQFAIRRTGPGAP